MRPKLTIGTRASQLALLQTQQVVNAIEAMGNGFEIVIKKITTTGDRDTTSALDQMGGVGVFVKELEKALASGEIDLAVHSLKDMPTIQPPGLSIAAVLPREDSRDALVSNDTISGVLTAGSKIGTGSLRRQVQLKKYYPEVISCPLRGNINTRLAKLDRGEYSGLVMAAAALIRMGLQERILRFLPLDLFIPAGGQGVIALETRQEGQWVSLLKNLNHTPTWLAASAERAFLNELGAGCHAPVGALATVAANNLELSVMVASSDGNTLIYDQATGDINDATKIGVEMARRMKAKGVPDFNEA